MAQGAPNTPNTYKGGWQILGKYTTVNGKMTSSIYTYIYIPVYTVYIYICVCVHPSTKRLTFTEKIWAMSFNRETCTKPFFGTASLFFPSPLHHINLNIQFVNFSTSFISIQKNIPWYMTIYWDALLNGLAICLHHRSFGENVRHGHGNTQGTWTRIMHAVPSDHDGWTWMNIRKGWNPAFFSEE